MTVTYYKISQDVLREDYILLEKKLHKLEQLHKGLGERVSIAEKGAKNDENKLTKAEAELAVEKAKVLRGEIRVREVLNNEFKNKTVKLEKENAILRKENITLQNTLDQNNEILKRGLFEQKFGKKNVMEMIENAESSKTEVIIIKNRLIKIVGRVNQARNRIVSLNANTPYRPGAVERTLVDVLEDLRNV